MSTAVPPEEFEARFGGSPTAVGGFFPTPQMWASGNPDEGFYNTGSALKFMAPGHFCPDVCGIEDFGDADYLRGHVVRAFFRLMKLWPPKQGKP